MKDKKDEEEKVQEYRRQHLEPEIAAMSVSIDDQDENPTLIVNIDDPAAKGAIKRVITWLGVIGGGIFAWSQRSAKEQMALAIAGTATLATVTTAAVTTITRDDADIRRQPVVAERVVTLQPGPPVTVTVSPKPSKTPPRTESPSPRPAPGKEQAARPTRSKRPDGGVRSPRSTRTPASVPSPTRSAQPSADEAPPPTKAPTRGADPSVAGIADLPLPTPPVPTPPVPPIGIKPPVRVASGCDGVVKVDVDPLPDLCLLG